MLHDISSKVKIAQILVDNMSKHSYKLFNPCFLVKNGSSIIIDDQRLSPNL